MSANSSNVSEPLANVLADLGISTGDLLLVHSDIRGLIRSRITTEEIGETLLDVVGDDGTLLFPTFSFAWARGEGFDLRNSPSEMGRLTEWARTDPRFVRTFHPVYSFAVRGPLASEFTRPDPPSGYGHGSGFQVLHELGGKILVIGLPWQRSMTFVHYVEEMRDVNYRYHKRFAGEYIDGDGRQSIRDYFIFVRNLEAGVETFVDDAEAHCSALGINRVAKALRTRLSVVDAPLLYDELSRQLDRNPSFLHRMELP